MLAMVITQEFGNDPLIEGRPGAVALPEGYYRVWRGAVKPGDLYLNWDQWSFHQRVQWHRVSELISDAEGYECLIRRGVPVDEVCSRCGCVNALPYSHHCNFCSDIVIESRRSIP